MTYEPSPIDTSSVELSSELSELTEYLAKNAHDLWARGRLAEGWRYGAERNDVNKTHPDLVHYSALAESEKDYDRNAAMETVKAITSLGFRIAPPVPPGSVETDLSASAVSFPAPEEVAALDLSGVLALWRAHDPEGRSRPVELHRRIAERLRDLGEPLFAYDVASKGLELWKDDTRLRQLQGLALADSGAPERANRILEALKKKGHADEETLGMLARTYKDLWRGSQSPEEKRRHLKAAYEEYSDAYERTGGYWTRINAATMAFLRDEKEDASATAELVREQCEKELNRIGKEGGGRYWLLATLGEASVILGDLGEAENRYKEAVGLAVKDHGKIASSRRQALLLAEHSEISQAVVEAWFPKPTVIVFAGHMIDRPDRPEPRFPARLEADVRQAIREQLEGTGPLIAYASAACGSDIIFLETVVDLKGAINIVLPYQQEDFVRDSVDVIPGADWRARCLRLLGKAQVVTVSDQRLPLGGVSYEYANQVLLGLARARTERLGAMLRPLAVWDGKQGDGSGGTSWILHQWREQGLESEVIRLDALLPGNGKPSTDIEPPSTAQSTPPAGPTTDDTHIMALLFADVENFSKMTEAQIPPFVNEFLGMVGKMTTSSEFKPVTKNTM